MSDVEILRRIEDPILNETTEVFDKPSVIKEFYENQKILVTGATGFLGKVLVEKLLRTCPKIETLYLLIRSKKDKDPRARLDAVFDEPLFDSLRRKQPKFRQKIVVVEGDCSKDGIGIDETLYEKMSSEITVIFHAAATVRFDEPLRVAVNVNVKGTKTILAFAEKCSRLKSFVHVSTAYSHCHRTEIEEIFYPVDADYELVMKLVELVPEEKINKMTKYLLGDFPNTYAYTKAMAEDFVADCAKNLPVCVFRPSIIVATYKEPVRGWCDNLFGATGVLIGSGLGIIRTLLCDPDNVADLVPVDMVVSQLLACGWKTAVDNATRLQTDIPIYNCVSSNQCPITWSEFMELNGKYGTLVPSVRCFWYYSLTLNKNRFKHVVYRMFLHYIPAAVVDTILYCRGQKPKMLKIYEKIDKLNNVITYFTLKQWTFTNENTKNLYREMNPCDQNIYNFDMSTLNWDEHSQYHIPGLRQYVIKEDHSTLPMAKIRWARFKMLHVTLKYLFVFLGLCIIYCFLMSMYKTLI